MKKKNSLTILDVPQGGNARTKVSSFVFVKPSSRTHAKKNRLADEEVSWRK